MSKRLAASCVFLAVALLAGFFLLASRALRAVRLEAESQVRDRLRATASEAAVRAEGRFATWLDERLLAEDAWRVSAEGRFLVPPEPAPLDAARLPPDTPAEIAFFLREGERAELREGDLGSARDFYRAAAREDGAPEVRRIALAREASVAARQGDAEEARRLWTEVAGIAGDTTLYFTAAVEGAAADRDELARRIARHLGSGLAEGFARLLGLADDPRVAARRRELEKMAVLRPSALPIPTADAIRRLPVSGTEIAFQRERSLALIRQGALLEILGPSARARPAPPAAGLSADVVGTGPLEGIVFRAEASPAEVDGAVRRQTALLLGAGGVATAAGVLGLVLLLRGVRREAQLARLKSDFVANVSHELRTPLARIRLYAESLSAGKVPEAERDDYVSVVEREAVALTALVDRVLDFAKIERGTKEYDRAERDLVPVVTAAGREAGARRPEVTLDVSVPDSRVVARFDPGAVAGAIENLVDNAVKHGGGKVEIALSALDEGGARVEVRDRGPGVPAEEAGRIFDRFHRGAAALRDAVRGSGLGLTLVRHAAEGHGGSAGFDERSGGGAVFWFTVESGG